MNANSQEKTRRLAGLALFTALIVILQLLGSFIRFGPVSVSLVALPIVIGAAVYGSAAGLWLGFVFGMVVLLSGDAAAFFAFSVPGTLLTVLVKGIACGGLAGLVCVARSEKPHACRRHRGHRLPSREYRRISARLPDLLPADAR